MIARLESGNKPKSDWRIGTEHEKIGFCLKEKTPIPYKGGIEAILDKLQRFDWAPVYEGDNVIALKRAGASVSLEPGGQLELSGAPLEHVHQTCAEVNRHLREVKEVADEIGAGFISLGFRPDTRLEDVPVMPKGRYNIMRAYMPKVGTHGLENDVSHVHRADQSRFFFRSGHGEKNARQPGPSAYRHRAFC